MRLSPIAAFALLVGLCALPFTVSAQPGNDKVTVCHFNGKGAAGALSISATALPAHLAHGDAVPNDFLPGSSSDVYDGACGVVSWTYGVNTAPDSSAIESGNDLFVGTGIPAENFGTATNDAAGVQLGLMILYRQGPTVAAVDTYADGVLEFNVNEGPQSTANGSFANNVNRAAWNFTYSIATGLNGASTDLQDFTFKILYDVDPGAGTSYQVLTSAPIGGSTSTIHWEDAGSLPVIGDDEGNANVSQNSQNYAFGFVQDYLTAPYGTSNSFAGPAAFDIVLQAFDGDQLVAQNHIRVNVVVP